MSPTPPHGELAERAHRVLEILKRRSGVANAMLVILTNPRRRMSYDMNYPFRPSSSMRYLAHCDAPDTVLVLHPRGAPRLAYLDRVDAFDGGSIAKNADLTPLDGLHDREGFERLFGYQALLKHVLPALAGGAQPFVAHDEDVWDTTATAPSVVDPHAPSTLVDRYQDLMRVLHARYDPFDARASQRAAVDAVREARLIKSEYEIRCLDRAASAANSALDVVDARVAEYTRGRGDVGGTDSEQDLDRTLKAHFSLNGSTSNSFPPIVAMGAHARVLHHRPTSTMTMRRAQPPQLVIDVGPSYAGYASDFTRSWWLEHAPTPDERPKLAYELVYGTVAFVLRDMIATCRAGARVGDVVRRFERVSQVFVGEIPEGIAPARRKDWLDALTPHGVVHWIGLDVHDPHPQGAHPALHDTKLRPGMCMALEPAYYFASDGPLAPRTEAMRGISIRLEASIVVRAQGPPRILGSNSDG